MSLVGLFLRVALAIRQGAGDLVPLYAAEVAFLHHQPPYSVHFFIYPPSILALMVPIGLISFGKAKAAFIVVDALTIWVAGLGCLRLAGLGLGTIRAASFMAALALLAPVAQTLNAANFNGLVLLAEVGFLLLVARGGWLRAGACLGVSIALKPVLLPLGLVLLVRRRWPSAGLAAVIPIGLSVLVTLALVDRQAFLQTTVPFLLRGEDVAAGENVAIAGTVARVGLPVAVGLALRVIAAGAGIGVLWRLRGQTTSIPFSIALLCTTFLVAPFSWPYYSIYALPLLAYAMDVRAYWTWLAVAVLYCLAAPDIALWLRLGQVGFDFVHIRVTVGFALALAAIWMASSASNGRGHGFRFAFVRAAPSSTPSNR